jgi:hypothetical protein
MQSAMRMLHQNLAELAGWVLILAGSALAALTLTRKGAPGIAFGGRAWIGLQPAAPTPMGRIDPANEWQRIEEIAGQGLSGITRVADLQSRAEQEVAAADQALSLLLAECGFASRTRDVEGLPTAQGADLQPASAGAAEASPLAA